MDEHDQTTALHTDGRPGHPERAAEAMASGEELTTRVMRALPRLRVIATHAALLGPIIIESGNSWGGGRGC